MHCKYILLLVAQCCTYIIDVCQLDVKFDLYSLVAVTQAEKWNIYFLVKLTVIAVEHDGVQNYWQFERHGCQCQPLSCCCVSYNVSVTCEIKLFQPLSTFD